MRQIDVVIIGDLFERQRHFTSLAMEKFTSYATKLCYEVVPVLRKPSSPGPSRCLHRASRRPKSSNLDWWLRRMFLPKVSRSLCVVFGQRGGTHPGASCVTHVPHLPVAHVGGCLSVLRLTARKLSGGGTGLSDSPRGPPLLTLDTPVAQRGLFGPCCPMLVSRQF